MDDKINSPTLQVLLELAISKDASLSSLKDVSHVKEDWRKRWDKLSMAFHITGKAGEFVQF